METVFFTHYSNLLFPHVGECRECVEVIDQPCRCGKLTQERPCSHPEWSCETVRNALCSYTCRVKCVFAVPLGVWETAVLWSPSLQQGLPLWEVRSLP